MGCKISQLTSIETLCLCRHGAHRPRRCFTLRTSHGLLAIYFVIYLSFFDTSQLQIVSCTICLEENCSVSQYIIYYQSRRVFMKAIVHHELQQTMTIHSTLPSLPEQRPTSSCRCGRSFVFSFCNDEDDVFVWWKA